MPVSAAIADSHPSLAFEVEYVDQAGEAQRRPLELALDVPFERVYQARSFPSLKGQSSFPGLWWAATTGCHVGYESWVERSVDRTNQGQALSMFSWDVAHGNR